MIRPVQEANRAPFLAAARGRPYFGDVMPLHLAVFGENHPRMRFYTASPAAALQLRGRSALLCGTYDREETGGFLALCGVERVQTDGAPPAGYARRRRLCCMALAAFAKPPLAAAGPSPPPFAGAPAAAFAGPYLVRPDVPPHEPPLAGLALDPAPPPGETADFLMGARGAEIRDNFYSELCAKLARGAACVWAVRRVGDGRMVATAGAYALTPETAYLAAVETAEPLRGKGVGSWLVGALAAQLAGEGRRVSLLCEEGRIAFYARLGFKAERTLWQYMWEAEAEETKTRQKQK